MRSPLEAIQDPRFVRRVNGWATVVFLVWIFPAMALKGVRESIPFLTFYSLWALVATHYGGWLTARVETRAKDIEEGGGNGE